MLGTLGGMLKDRVNARAVQALDLMPGNSRASIKFWRRGWLAAPVPST